MNRRSPFSIPWLHRRFQPSPTTAIANHASTSIDRD
uniref:Uncharacterized protein n=1 Tax=Manihot esculenta TaxID=3983 RepID=A0A2C9WIM7_MANES